MFIRIIILSQFMDKDAIDELIENLNRIPKQIDSRIFIKELEEKIMENLRRKISI